MPSTIGAALGKAGLTCSIAIGLYATLLGILLHPSAQRFALYAHKINTLFLGDNLSDPEQFGFSNNQVTPFKLPTPDGETLYAWHILPLDVYTRNEKSIQEEIRRRDGPVDDFTHTKPFHLLTANDPEPARVIINFHGNAGHVAQGWRTDNYRLFSSLPNTHVLTVDYRGFGHSTGSPTEQGLVIDGIALVEWVLNIAEIPPERIVIVGQSLGTAVASAVGLAYLDPADRDGLVPWNPGMTLRTRESPEADDFPPYMVSVTTQQKRDPTTFAGIILIAPFSSLPSLLLTYRIGGLIPLLLPLRPFPYLGNLLTSQVLDSWRSGDRLAAYYRRLRRFSHSSSSSSLSTIEGMGNGSLQLIHAVNDADIPYHETEKICQRIFRDDGADVDGHQEAGGEDHQQHYYSQVMKCLDEDGKGPARVVGVPQEDDRSPRVRIEIVQYGGHNRIVTYSPVAAAVLRAFENLF
ncbi:alpha/beta-hydrolase [Hortaea werneckii]|nr:alpha/beta-hydrolase [Hortaea werneckii]KAI7014268.1 alpha/beta-hydrolase [Hortaea werneckii]KAI7669211.1 alpha/beta-hydrolase [Hortaea werneckii]